MTSSYGNGQRSMAAKRNSINCNATNKSEGSNWIRNMIVQKPTFANERARAPLASSGRSVTFSSVKACS